MGAMKFHIDESIRVHKAIKNTGIANLYKNSTHILTQVKETLSFLTKSTVNINNLFCRSINLML